MWSSSLLLSSICNTPRNCQHTSYISVQIGKPSVGNVICIRLRSDRSLVFEVVLVGGVMRRLLLCVFCCLLFNPYNLIAQELDTATQAEGTSENTLELLIRATGGDVDRAVDLFMHPKIGVCAEEAQCSVPETSDLGLRRKYIKCSSGRSGFVAKWAGCSFDCPSAKPFCVKSDYLLVINCSCQKSIKF